MIGRLRGRLVDIDGDVVTLDVGGVGHEVTLTPNDIAVLPSIGEEVVVHCHLVVREDALTLYGFTERRKRDLYRMLLAAPGVGPKLAMAALAALTPASLITAIVSEDVEVLVQIPGVGKRSAQKLIIELKPRLSDFETETIGNGGQRARVRQALESLGYGRDEIGAVLEGVDDDRPVAEQVAQALKAMGR